MDGGFWARGVLTDCSLCLHSCQLHTPHIFIHALSRRHLFTRCTLFHHQHTICICPRTATCTHARYTRVRTLIDPWCHGPALGRDPISGRWIWTHMGNGTGPRGGNPDGCLLCTNGSIGTGSAVRTNASDGRSPVKLFDCPRNDNAGDRPHLYPSLSFSVGILFSQRHFTYE